MPTTKLYNYPSSTVLDALFNIQRVSFIGVMGITAVTRCTVGCKLPAPCSYRDRRSGKDSVRVATGRALTYGIRHTYPFR